MDPSEKENESYFSVYVSMCNGVSFVVSHFAKIPFDIHTQKKKTTVNLMSSQ